MMRTNECDYCHEPAVWKISAQWTIFDYDHSYACWQHVTECQRDMMHLVDDNPVREMLADRIPESEESPSHTSPSNR